MLMCTMYNIQCTMYIVHCTLYKVHCTLYNVHCIMYIMNMKYRKVYICKYIDIYCVLGLYFVVACFSMVLLIFGYSLSIAIRMKDRDYCG